MESEPIIEIIEIDGVRKFAIVGNLVRGQDILADFIFMVICDDGVVKFFYCRGIERATGLFEDPRFELWISGAFFRDKGNEFGARDAETGQHHLVITLAAAGVIRMQLSRRLQGCFQPKAREMENAKGAGGAGTDEWDDLGHDRGKLWSAPER